VSHSKKARIQQKGGLDGSEGDLNDGWSKGVADVEQKQTAGRKDVNNSVWNSKKRRKCDSVNSGEIIQYIGRY
jgi:hypothetical protein